MDVAKQLAALGASPAMIAGALCNGKPIDFDERPKGNDRYKSKAEKQYSWLLDDERRDGHIARWEYEALTFVLAPCSELGGRAARFTPDFCVWCPDGRLELREIKGGFVREAARVRFLVAKRLYPEFAWRMIQKQGAGWADIL